MGPHRSARRHRRFGRHIAGLTFGNPSAVLTVQVLLGRVRMGWLGTQAALARRSVLVALSAVTLASSS